MAEKLAIIFTRRASRDAARIIKWWHEHRAAASGLFEQELVYYLANLAILCLD